MLFMPGIGSKHSVLHLIDSAGMYGAEKVIVTLLVELKYSHFPGILGCIRERENEIPQIAIEAANRNIPIHYFTMKRGFNFSGIRSISTFARENKITVIHSHGYKPNIFLNFISARQVKKIATVHGWSKETGALKSRIYEFLDSLALRRMHCIVAVSKAVENDLASRGLRKDRIEIIYNGIIFNQEHNNSQADVSQLRAEYNISNCTFVIGTLGRLVNVKGHNYLIQAMPFILKEIPNCVLLIAGTGSLKTYLENLIKDLDLVNNVKLIGYVKDLNKFFSIIDLFVLPSLSEGLPISLIEAMAFGKPIVASMAGGIPEVIVNEDTGILIPPANVNKLEKTIINLSKDKDKMQRLSANSRKFVKTNFSSTNIAKQYENIYLKFFTG